MSSGCIAAPSWTAVSLTQSVIVVYGHFTSGGIALNGLG
jgi:hypothetical protein